MKKRITLTSRVLAIVMLLTSLLPAGYSPAQMAGVAATDTNVFAGAGVTATANGYISDDFAPSKAIDGSKNSGKWSYAGGSSLPDPANPYWIKVDVGAEALVRQFVLFHAGAAGEPDSYNTRDYSIEVSTDDVNWTPAVTVTGNTYQETAHTLSVPVQARYFKLNITDPGAADAATGGYAANIYEFQAWGSMVGASAVQPDGIRIDKPNLDLLEGETEQLSAILSPPGAATPNLIWSSDNPAVAGVDANGLVTGVSEGSTVVTVTTEDGAHQAAAVINVGAAGAAILAAGLHFIEKDSQWTYLDDGSDQGTAWKEPNFDDSSWKKAPAPLGYAGSGKGQDLNTWIGYGSDAGNKHLTTYFRQEFQVTDAAAIKQLEASLIRDDGAVIYLNGQEVYRTNMPSGEITYRTTASTAVGDERNAYVFEIDPALLVDGTNVMAASVHQDRGASSDLFFSLELKGSDSAPPVVGKDNGLLGEYYTGRSNFDFGDHKGTAIDSRIEFRNLDPILQSLTGQADNANVRWTGQIMPPQTDDYTFYMIGDNGFRLWIDDQLIIDHWVNDWDIEQTSTPIHLNGGQKYKIKIEYFEDYGGSNLYLRWSTPSMAKEIVPDHVFYLPEDYNGPVAATVMADGLNISLEMLSDLGALPGALQDHITVTADDTQLTLLDVLQDRDPSLMTVQVAEAITPIRRVNIAYDGLAGLQLADGTNVGSFAFTAINQSEVVDYTPFDIAMSLHGDAKTRRSFAWYSQYPNPATAPAGIRDSEVQVVRAGESFDSPTMKSFRGTSEEIHVRVTRSTNANYLSHKVVVEGLEPGTTYQYRLGSGGYWSKHGQFTTEREEENEFSFLYMTDSQGGNTDDYKAWADTVRAGVQNFPDSKFLLMPGDMVDVGDLEEQWHDYFTQPQDELMNLPLMTTIGNHEGPYNNNFYYHFNLPDNSFTDSNPAGAVYSFDYGPAHFMVLNTGDIPWDNAQKSSFEKQIEWLRKEVAQTDKKWKVVAFHKAIYSVGGHALDRDILELRETLYPIMDELGIDLVLQGHDHTFMRSFQMYGDKPVQNVVTDSNGNVIDPDGTLYLINNAAGRKYYGVRGDVDKYYAAKYSQPYKPMYTGIKVTEDSLTLQTYITGESAPMDEYTIVRNDGRPDAVEGLSAGKSGNGRAVLSWSMPQTVDAEDPIRGFRIHEVNGQLGPNWSAYIPVEAGKTSYQYEVPGTTPNEAYEFAVTTVDKRDNSAAVKVAVSGNVPAAPTAPVVDDGHNTFGWTHVPGYEQPSDYEFSVDGGTSWQPVTANPQPVGDGNYPAGEVMVRVQADAASGRQAGLPLASDKPFTENSLHETFQLSGEVTRDGQLKVDVKVARAAEYSGDPYVVFELMDGNTPLLINAIPIRQDVLEVSQYFNVNGSQYSVKVFVFDEFNSDPEVPIHLAKPIELR
ncbi:MULTISPECIES: PA14 domain-containing protein [Paenibacillus]|uniref:Metallophosphoesterase n=1 Tax=Paenibacillus campinasensis TaxID=66347 RepID=A0A268ETN7_9BACL|nr:MULTISPECIES: PA14 domain-containing protein [Paenibacillus]PAD76461.1 hypothetical protein CHH67_12640 [Paenibacillus campinasensis]PAK55002.1 hypothetical protein CHH75_05620 [Paenibacillus sp. 7541]